jgi:hypothetical protein
MLESGPSESSSEGENDLDGTGTSAVATSDKRKSGGVLKADTNTIESGLMRKQNVLGTTSPTSITTIAERALKVKLRLPSHTQQVQQQTSESSTSSPSSFNNAVNNITSSKLPEANSIVESQQKVAAPKLGNPSTNPSTLESGGTCTDAKTKVVEPKLPKLILSMREKKVKLAQESAAAASNKSQKVSGQAASGLNASGDRKKERKLPTSEDEGSDSEDVDEEEEDDMDEVGDDDLEDEEDDEEDVEDEDLDEADDDDDEEMVKISLSDHEAVTSTMHIWA